MAASRKKPGADAYTDKNDVIKKHKDQTIDKVTDYDNTGLVGNVPVSQATRNYY